MIQNVFQLKEGWAAQVCRNFTYYNLYYMYDLVPKGVHENRTEGVENKVDDTLKLVVFLECAQC